MAQMVTWEVKVDGSMPGKSLRARGKSSSMKGTTMKTEKGTRRNKSDTVRTNCLQDNDSRL